MFDGLSPSYTKVINCFCISLESSKGNQHISNEQKIQVTRPILLVPEFQNPRISENDETDTRQSIKDATNKREIDVNISEI